MKETESSQSNIGAATSVTTPDTSAALNVEEYASTPAAPDRHRTGFPKQGGQSLSYWLQQVRCDPLLDHRTTKDLPKEADTVIIGSGISGTLIAKHHLETWPTKSVVVLEAREFCSGATGRNAGHCKPDQWRHYGKFEKAYGTEQAIKIMNNEAATWKALVAYVKENNVDCDLWVGETLDVPLDDEVAELAREVFGRYKEAGGKVDHITVTQDPAAAEEKSRIKGAKACYAWQASTLQPWKLTAHIMRENLKKGLNLQTYTTAHSITPSSSSSSSASVASKNWTIHTSRGPISTPTIIHATNAYSAALLPSLLRGLITPKPHICTRVIPPRSHSGSAALKNSYGVLLPDGGLFSINPRCTADGNVLFGGSNPGQKRLDKWVEGQEDSGVCVDDGLAGGVESVEVQGVMECVRGLFGRSLGGGEMLEGKGMGEGMGKGERGAGRRSHGELEWDYWAE
ncbi:hypothetical protein N0V83_008604 [Neocucurbitaria cava]|uniref:FAD dependent oxidoreductase domain-containing protein n=1 Tax=Neocucurbitaria cava TaxID=798079 RepID=A0A9W8Y2L0_9PLEO|nr:hypothetical protein N0V83_008604 [Neocucurbitaria cava]